MDEERGRQVVETLHHFFKEKENLAQIAYPSTIQYKSNEYCIYMFYSCLLDYGMKSKRYHENLVTAYQKEPELFQPKKVCSLSEEELKNMIVQNIHPRYPNIATKKWKALSKELEKVDSLRNDLESIKSFQELTTFINNLHCYGQKTGGLLIRILCDAKIGDFDEAVEAIPIDRHDMEISYLTGITNSKNLTEKEITQLSNTYVTIGKELHINPSDIDKYLWELGSSFCNLKKCEQCPIKQCLKKEMTKK